MVPTLTVNSAVLPTLVFSASIRLFYIRFHLLHAIPFVVYSSTSYYAYSFIVCLYLNNGCHSFSARFLLSVRCLFLLLLLFFFINFTFFLLSVLLCFLAVFSLQCLNTFSQEAPRLKNFRVFSVLPGLIVRLIVRYLNCIIDQTKELITELN